MRNRVHNVSSPKVMVNKARNLAELELSHSFSTSCASFASPFNRPLAFAFASRAAMPSSIDALRARVGLKPM